MVILKTALSADPKMDPNCVSLKSVEPLSILASSILICTYKPSYFVPVSLAKVSRSSSRELSVFVLIIFCFRSPKTDPTTFKVTGRSDVDTSNDNLALLTKFVNLSGKRPSSFLPLWSKEPWTEEGRLNLAMASDANWLTVFVREHVTFLETLLYAIEKERDICSESGLVE